MKSENNGAIQHLFKQAVDCQLKNDPNSALKIYQNIIARHPDHIGALNNMGVIYLARGENDRAEQVLDKALRINPSHPDALNNMATALKNRGDYQGAVSMIRKALSAKPVFKSAWFNLGNTYREMGDDAAAATAYGRAVALDPADPESLSSLGAALYRRGRGHDAKQVLQQSIQADSRHAKSHYHLGLVFMDEGRMDAAFDAFEAALTVNPDYSDAYLNLGNIRVKQGRLADAVSFFKSAVAADPLSADAYYNLVLAHETAGDLDSALRVQKDAMERLPSAPQSLVSGARLFMKIADWKIADPLLHRLLRYPFSASEHALLSDALILFHSMPVLDDALYDRHRLWGDFACSRTEQLSGAQERCFARPRNAAQRIRIGYVSPDMRRHSVGWFLKQIIGRHDPRRFETYCYAAGSIEDDVTRAIERDAGVFKRVAGLSTRDLARTLYDDRIDILVDLAGHTQGTRLDVFSLRCAPVQVTAFGYPNGTGLATVDYRITDRHAETSGTIVRYRESPVLLSGCFLPLGPLDADPMRLTKADLNIAEDTVFLVSFNRAEKLRPQVLDLWNRILTRCPGSVLGLGCGYVDRKDLRANILSHFSPVDHHRRIRFLGRAPSEESHRTRYGPADLALDTFPYSGTTTSYEALRMHTPVVTLVGDHHVQRTTYSILKQLGVLDTVAYSQTEYVDTAVHLIEHPKTLADIKTRLSQAFRDPAVIDPKAYVAKLEAAFKIMWDRYLKGEPVDTISF